MILKNIEFTLSKIFNLLPFTHPDYLSAGGKGSNYRTFIIAANIEERNNLYHLCFKKLAGFSTDYGRVH